MKVFLTGASGFIGSHILEHGLRATDWEFICPVTFQHKGDSLRLQHLNHERVRIFHHDLTSPISERMADSLGAIDFILHAAAESHVDRSIEDPVPFVKNNVAVTLNVLEYARLVRPLKMIQVSTDEVYGPAPDKVNHREWAAILPSNPYSASKAAQEAIAVAYWRTYGVPVAITNTMNNFGERQDTEKYVARVIRAVHRGDEVDVHGELVAGKWKAGSRMYLHARNHADALLHLLGQVEFRDYPRFSRPSRWNIVGDVELDNLTLAQMVAEIMERPLKYRFSDFHKYRPGHDRRYALDGKLLQAMGWKPPVAFAESLERTITWTLANPEWLL